MKKTIVLLALLLCLVACGSKSIKPGNYVIVNKNNRPIYLIDINSGERLIELRADKFYIEIKGDKKIASFYVDYTNFNNESKSTKAVELGFFNGKIKATSEELSSPGKNSSQNAIVLLPGLNLESVQTGEIIGETLSSYGPILYSDYRDGYYYFYIGINYLRVAESGVTIIKRPDGQGGGQQFDGELYNYAFGFLPADLQLMILDRTDVFEEQTSIGSEGVIISNKDMSREILISNQDVIIVTYLNLREEHQWLAVYLEADTYSFIGIKLIVLEIEPREGEDDY